MEYRRFGQTIVLRLDQGDEIMSSILSIARTEQIPFASVSGIGATDNVTLGIFNLTSHDYDRFHYEGNREITSLVGNITTKKNEPYCHLHLNCAGSDKTVIGGHLLEGYISLTAEIVIRIIDAFVDREFVEELQIQRFLFS